LDRDLVRFKRENHRLKEYGKGPTIDNANEVFGIT